MKQLLARGFTLPTRRTLPHRHDSKLRRATHASSRWSPTSREAARAPERGPKSPLVWLSYSMRAPEGEAPRQKAGELPGHRRSPSRAATHTSPWRTHGPTPVTVGRKAGGDLRGETHRVQQQPPDPGASSPRRRRFASMGARGTRRGISRLRGPHHNASTFLPGHWQSSSLRAKGEVPGRPPHGRHRLPTWVAPSAAVGGGAPRPVPELGARGVGQRQPGRREIREALGRWTRASRAIVDNSNDDAPRHRGQRQPRHLGRPGDYLSLRPRRRIGRTRSPMHTCAHRHHSRRGRSLLCYCDEDNASTGGTAPLLRPTARPPAGRQLRMVTGCACRDFL